MNHNKLIQAVNVLMLLNNYSTSVQMAFKGFDGDPSFRRNKNES